MINVWQSYSGFDGETSEARKSMKRRIGLALCSASAAGCSRFFGAFLVAGGHGEHRRFVVVVRAAKCWALCARCAVFIPARLAPTSRVTRRGYHVIFFVHVAFVAQAGHAWGGGGAATSTVQLVLLLRFTPMNITQFLTATEAGTVSLEEADHVNARLLLNCASASNSCRARNGGR